MNLRRIDVLLDEESKEEFHRGNLIEITTKGTYGNDCTGVIRQINTLELTIDTSQRYESNIRTIKYEDISKIRRLNQ